MVEEAAIWWVATNYNVSSRQGSRLLGLPPSTIPCLSLPILAWPLPELHKNGDIWQVKVWIVTYEDTWPALRNVLSMSAIPHFVYISTIIWKNWILVYKWLLLIMKQVGSNDSGVNVWIIFRINASFRCWEISQQIFEICFQATGASLEIMMVLLMPIKISKMHFSCKNLSLL